MIIVCVFYQNTFFQTKKKKKIQKCKWSRIVKTIWEKKKVRDTSPDTKFYYIATVTNGA